MRSDVGSIGLDVFAWLLVSTGARYSRRRKKAVEVGKRMPAEPAVVLWAAVELDGLHQEPSG